MARELHHDRMSLPPVPAMGRGDDNDIEVWHDEPDEGQPAHVVLHLELARDPWIAIDLLPEEARALAGLLINAASHQDRRAKAVRS